MKLVFSLLALVLSKAAGFTNPWCWAIAAVSFVFATWIEFAEDYKKLKEEVNDLHDELDKTKNELWCRNTNGQ